MFFGQPCRYANNCHTIHYCNFYTGLFGDVMGVWTTVMSSGNKATYNIKKDGSIRIEDCSWSRCYKYPHAYTTSTLEQSDNMKYPYSEGWLKASGLHSSRSTAAVFMKRDGQMMQTVYYMTSSSLYPGTADFGKSVSF